MKPKTGTREWSSSSANVMSGCGRGPAGIPGSGSCLYCYGSANAIRFGQHTRETWAQETERPGIRDKRWGRRKGIIMFPTTHDITTSNFGACLSAILGMLNAGNRLLIVSKPDQDVVAALCSNIAAWKHAVTLRFTIGSLNPVRLAFWEPGAPTFGNRLAALMWAHREGWTTSVSMEPILDLTVERVVELAQMLAPYVTETIWIGVANHLKQRVTVNCGKLDDEGRGHVEKLVAAWTPEAIKRLVWSVESDARLRDKVRWKDGITRVIGHSIEGGRA